MKLAAQVCSHIFSAIQMVFVTDGPGSEAGSRCDILPGRGDQHPAQITAGTLRVINEVRGNRKDR